MKALSQLILIVFSLFYLSCINNKITSSWRKSGFKATRYHKVLVMALLSKESDWSLRESLEKHMVDDIKVLGYDAISSFMEYGPITINNLTEQQALNKINMEGFVSIVTIVLLDQSQERIFIPQRPNQNNIEGHDGYWWPYYDETSGRIGQSGYYVTESKYYWESNLYMGASKELVYSVKTKSFDPSSTKMLAHHYGKVVIKEMTKNKVL